MKKKSILTEDESGLKFSQEVAEYILDENMQLKAVKLKNGVIVDSEHLHSEFNPKHPLLRTPTLVKRTLDQFFLHEFTERRLPTGV